MPALAFLDTPPTAHPITTVTTAVSINEHSSVPPAQGIPENPRYKVGQVVIPILYRGWPGPRSLVEKAGFEPRQSAFRVALSVMWLAPTYWPATLSKALQAGFVLREPLIPQRPPTHSLAGRSLPGSPC